MGRQKGFKNSEEAKQKMRENNWFKRGFTPSMLGKHHSEETKKKIALAHTGYKFSNETKKKMSLAKIGKSFRLGCKHTEESKQKMRLSHIGHIPWCIGKKLSIEHKRKLSIAHKGKILSKEWKRKISEGVERHYWETGKTCKIYALGWTNTFKEQIRYRDEYKCQLCGIPEIENGRKLDVHHIDYDKKNIKQDNLVSLCFGCHKKTNYNREYWKQYFGGGRYEENVDTTFGVISNTKDSIVGNPCSFYKWNYSGCHRGHQRPDVKQLTYAQPELRLISRSGQDRGGNARETDKGNQKVGYTVQTNDITK